MTPEQRAVIETKIIESIAGNANEVVRRTCAEAHALPLYLDWGGCLAIRPNGEIVQIEWESREAREIEAERWRNLALFQGSRRDPDLQWLVPLRPPDALDCPDCHGTGKLPFSGEHAHLATIVVCSCGGLGWVPAAPPKPIERSKIAEPMKRRGRFPTRDLVLAVTIPMVLHGLSLLGFFPWSGINCTQSDIDLNSGRIRNSRYLFWVPVTRTVRGSALTKALSPRDRAGSSEDWRPVNTLSPRVHHSPHYRFHGAIHQVRVLEICWEVGKMAPAARRETAREVIRLWREAGEDFLARHYLQKLWERVLETEKTGTPVEVDDLPGIFRAARVL